MAITVYQDLATANNSRALSWSPTWANGDVIAALAQTWDASITIATPTGSGLTFPTGTPLRQQNTTAVKNFLSIWATTAVGSGSATVTATTSGSSLHTGVLLVLPAADGYSLDTTPNSGTATGVAHGNISGASGNIAIGCSGDFNGGTGTAVYTTDTAATSPASAVMNVDSDQVYWIATLSGATTDVGCTTPSSGGTSWLGMEILKSAGAPPAYPFELLTQTPRSY